MEDLDRLIVVQDQVDALRGTREVATIVLDHGDVVPVPRLVNLDGHVALDTTTALVDGLGRTVGIFELDVSALPTVFSACAAFTAPSTRSTRTHPSQKLVYWRDNKFSSRNKTIRRQRRFILGYTRREYLVNLIAMRIPN